MNTTIEAAKLIPYLKKGKFYNFFINYVPASFDEMKREMCEIVSENRKIKKEKALYVKHFRISEVEKFIISNDLQHRFNL